MIRENFIALLIAIIAIAGIISTYLGYDMMKIVGDCLLILGTALVPKINNALRGKGSD